MINNELIEILACPKCKGVVELAPDKTGIICKACNVLYEIRDEIPIMLIDEAKKIAND
ncbi:MAG: Trm112 family protein [Desulfobulbaceae bacterium]|nr:MAG: Trm112 family protein [Desulfobulbaceae bacterium]